MQFDQAGEKQPGGFFRSLMGALAIYRNKSQETDACRCREPENLWLSASLGYNLARGWWFLSFYIHDTRKLRIRKSSYQEAAFPFKGALFHQITVITPISQTRKLRRSDLSKVT